MPLARIDLPAGKPASYRRAVADVVYEAMVETLKAPKDDRFQVIAEHAADTRIIAPTCLGIARRPDARTLQLTCSKGRPVEGKQAFYQAAAAGVAHHATLRRE